MNGPDLFAAAAERLAIVSGLPVSQALARIAGTDVSPTGPLFDEAGFDYEHPLDEPKC